METWQSWLNARDSKSRIQATVSRVRTPSSPPSIFGQKKGILMKKFFVRLICCFTPNRKKRHEIWHNFNTKNGYEAPDYIKDLENKITILNNDLQNLKTELCDATLRGTARLISTAALHSKTFAGYRNKFAGKTVVLVGAGPTLSKFKPIKNAIYVGLNRAFLFDKVKFDYLFSIDKAGIHGIYDKFIEYDCVKFIGDQNYGSMYQIPESIINKMPNVLRYKTDAALAANSDFPFATKVDGIPFKFALDIETEPLGNFNTVSLQAIQFILYTNPAKIYLVGIDCSADGHFTDNTENHIENFAVNVRGSNINRLVKNSVVYWKQLKEFADIYYPETEIISVNPVGLKGVFKDLFQE